MDAELISLLEEQVDKSDLADAEKSEVKETLAVLPTVGLQALYKAFELGPLHVRAFFEVYKRRKSILEHKDIKAWRKLLETEVKQALL